MLNESEKTALAKEISELQPYNKKVLKDWFLKTEKTIGYFKDPQTDEVSLFTMDDGEVVSRCGELDTNKGLDNYIKQSVKKQYGEEFLNSLLDKNGLLTKGGVSLILSKEALENAGLYTLSKCFAKISDLENYFPDSDYVIQCLDGQTAAFK